MTDCIAWFNFVTMDKITMVKLEKRTYLKENLIWIVFLLFSSSAFAQQDNWIEFKSLDDQYELLFPDAPNYKEKEVLTNLGNITTQNFSVVFDKDQINYLYSLNIVDYPEGTFHPDSTELINLLFENSVTQLAEDTHHEVLYMSDHVEQGVPSFNYRLTDKNKGLAVKGKAFLVGDRFYNLNVHTANPNSLNEFMDRFIDSFLLRQ